MSYKLTTLMALLFSIALCLDAEFPIFTVHAQTATPEPVVEEAVPVPPTPTPIVIVITESVSVGETSGEEVLDPITEAIAIEDVTSTIDPITEVIAIEDATSTIGLINETIAIEDSTSTIDPITETIQIETKVYVQPATGCLPPLNRNNLPPPDADRAPAPESGGMPSPDAARERTSEEGCVPPSDMDAESQRPAEGGAFSRGTGSAKESGEGSDDGSPSKAGNAGSTWMVVVYVIAGLGAAAALGLLGRWLLSTRSAS